MLGHASITLTVDTYGKWLPMGNKAAVDRLDEGLGVAGDRRRGQAGPGTPVSLRRRVEDPQEMVRKYDELCERALRARPAEGPRGNPGGSS